MELNKNIETFTNKDKNKKENKFFSTLKLNNELYIPSKGFGTYKLENIEESIENAIKIGYRLFDTAKFYNNEIEIGKAINKCINSGLVKREELFISTKIWMDDLEDPEKALKIALDKLNLNYVDVYIYHWPLPLIEDGKIKKMFPLYKTWEKLEKCVEKNLTRSLGISNFNVQLILDLLSYCEIKPVLLQVEIHPIFQQPLLREFCERFDLKIMAYNPLLRGNSSQLHKDYEEYNLFNNELLRNLSIKYNKTIPQIILNWHFKNGIIAIPKSSTYNHQLENFESNTFIMKDEDYLKINEINKDKRFNFSSKKPFSGGIEVFI
jgi:diketogulonate reductase-like aldo/keto reductase